MSAGDHADLAAQLREAERGEAAAWAAYPADGWWRPLALGAWAAAFVLVQGLDLDTVGNLGGLALALLPLGFVLWERGRSRAYPEDAMPPELSRSTWVLAGVLAIAVAVSVVAFLVLALAWAAVVAGVSTAAATFGYGRAYRADVDRVRRRLG